jgi:hypothetical protein
MDMKRVAILFLVAVVFALAPAAVNAQGLFGSGLPSFGGLLGGPSGCGEKLSPGSNLEFYVGWMDDRTGTSINVDTTGITIGGASSLRHNFPNRGLWLGLSDTVVLSDRLSFIASGWYLVPSNSNSLEQYDGNFANTLSRTWDTDARWWYVDGLFAVGLPGGFNFLAGLRYDSYNVRFKNPFNVNNVISLPSDTADAISEGWIPLIGAQYSQSSSAGSLVVRAVGVPTLVGNIKYNQTLQGRGRAEARGNYDNGWFLELFAEYSKSFGPGSVGVFGRWNGTQGNSNVDFQILGFAGNETWRLSVHRNAWTVGGSFSLNFTLPYM